MGNRRWGIFFGHFFALGWLFFLVFPLVDAIQRRRLGLALALLGFSALYCHFWIRARVASQDRIRLGQVDVAGMALIVILLSSSGQGTLSLLIYVAVAGGSIIAGAWVIPFVAGLAVLVAALGWATGLDRTTFTVLLIETPFTGLAAFGVGILLRTNLELRRAREEVAQLAVAEERLRFARDLHDLLGHSLSVVVLKAELARRLVPDSPERAAVELEDIERVARNALGEVREAVAGYRLASLDQELDATRATLEAAGVRADVRRLAGGLPAAAEGILAWVVREGVTNVLRHSRARRCSVILEKTALGYSVEVSDDGRGGVPDSRGNGLRGLRERVESAGGTLEAGARAEGGFRLRATLPATSRGAVPT